MLDKQSHSIGELFSELANDTGVLIRQELALAKTELTEKAVRMGRDVGILVVGGALAYAALFALLASLIIALANVMQWWLAALLVAVVVGAVAAVLVLKSLTTLKKTKVMPRQTVETMKENAQWAKQQMK